MSGPCLSIRMAGLGLAEIESACRAVNVEISRLIHISVIRVVHAETDPEQVAIHLSETESAVQKKANAATAQS